MLLRNMMARPRHAPWIEAVVDSSNQLLCLKNTRDRQRHTLNETASLIWSLCDGSLNITQILTIFEAQYPKQSHVRDDVMLQIEALLAHKAIVLDGGEDALEYKGSVVRQIKPTAELLWHLELIRQFVFGCTRIEEAKPLETDLEALLGPDALAIAKQHDIDAARSNQDSTVIAYRAAMSGKSFQKSLKKIVKELRTCLPEVDSKIEVSGNSIYRPGSHMGWHSNHSRSDGRIYCSWAQRGESNFFRYVDPLTGETVTHWEDPGWNIKSFTIPPKTSRLWHCIGANSLRLSLGFRYELPDAND